MGWIPGWDSVASTHSWSNFYFGASICALILLGIFEVISHRYSERKEELAAAEQDSTQRRHDEEMARLHLETAKANERAAELNTALEKEREKTSARPWKKEQFDAIQEIKGVVTDVGIIVQDKCLECRLYAIHIELALNEAGVTLHGEDVSFGADWGGVQVYIPTPQNAPNVAEIFSNHPLIKALTKGAIPHVVTNFLNCSECRKDIPVIMIGAIKKEFLTIPY